MLKLLSDSNETEDEQALLEELVSRLHNKITDAELSSTCLVTNKSRDYLREKRKQIVVQNRVERLEAKGSDNKKT